MKRMMILITMMATAAIAQEYWELVEEMKAARADPAAQADYRERVEKRNAARAERFAAAIAQEDQTALAELAKSNDGRYYVDVHKIMDNLNQASLADVVKNSRSSFVCEAAMGKLTDPAILVDMAKNEKESWIRSRAIGRLNVQEHQVILEEISKSDESLQIRLSVMARLGDPVVFAEFETVILATRDAFWERKKEATDDVPQDQTQLAEVAKNNKNKGVRIKAVKRIADQAVLAEVARNDKDWLVRWFAISKIDNQALLTELAEKDKDSLIRKEAAERLERIREEERRPNVIEPGGTLREIIERRQNEIKNQEGK